MVLPLELFLNPSDVIIRSVSSGIGAGRSIRIGPVAKRLTKVEGSVGRAVVEYDCGRIGLDLFNGSSDTEVEECTVGRIVCDVERPLRGAISGRSSNGASEGLYDAW